MTANDMKFSFQLKFDSLFEFTAPEYDDRHISYLLTEAQWRVFISKYNPLADKYQKGFEGSEQRRRDLEQLIKSSTITTQSSSQTGVHPGGVFIDLPTDFLYSIEEAVKLSNVATESWVKPVRHDEFLSNINNPYKKPYKNLVWRMDFSRADYGEDGGDSFTGRTPKRTEIILPFGYTLTHYRVRYLSIPPDIVCNEFQPADQRHCVLDETLHREIVDEAVAIAKAAVKPEEYQTSLTEKQRSQ